MSDKMARTSLGESGARNLADVTKTTAQMGSLGPRWLMRMLSWADVDAGVYRVNRVRVIGSDFERVETRVDGETAELKPANLRAVPLFRDLSEPMLEGLAKRFQSIQIPKGTRIIAEGDPGSEMFVLCGGQVEVYREGFKSILATYERGNFFGEMALLTGNPRTASVRTRTPVLILKLQKSDFEALLQEHPGMREILERTVADRLAREERGPVELTTTGGGEQVVTQTFIDYEETPQEIVLSSIVTTLRVHTRVMDLYKQPYDQLREQARLVIEAMKERQEWELINNEDFGLAQSVVPSLRIATRLGPPTPNDLDELLGRVWKEPAFFLAHPLTIAAFGRECTRRGVPPPTVTLYGAPFLTWRGVPLIPSDKIQIDYSGPNPTSRIFLMRVGEERRGVVGVHQSNIGDERLPSFAIRFNGVDQLGVANYLVSVYFSLSVLADDALGSLDNVVLNKYE
jgi:CRP-like cAMP-binding protein